MQNSQPLTLRRNFSWIFVGNAIYAVCQWGMLVVLAKLGTPEMVGQFTLGFAVTAPVIMFTNLQLRTVQATDAKREYRFEDYLGLRLIATSLALGAIAAITIQTGYRWQTAIVILLIGLAKAFESISDVFQGLFQQYERMDRIAISLLFKGPLSLLVLGIGVYLSGSVIWGAMGLALVWAGVLLVYDVPNAIALLRSTFPPLPVSPSPRLSPASFNNLKPRWHRPTLLKIIKLSLPLGLVMMLISLNLNIPRYFIERYLGERELGIFAAISYLMLAGQMVLSAMADSATPQLAKLYAQNDEDGFIELLLKLAAIGTFVGVGGLLFAVVAGKQFLTILYKPEYAQYLDVFMWLMIAAAINYSFAFLGYGRTAARYFSIQVPMSSLVTGASALACFWLIPSMGLKGAAIALVVGAVMEAVTNFGVILHAIYRIRNKEND
jgi:O-antigen/teichoic acid export membrane protein